MREVSLANKPETTRFRRMLVFEESGCGSKLKQSVGEILEREYVIRLWESMMGLSDLRPEPLDFGVENRKYYPPPRTVLIVQFYSRQTND